MGIVEQVLLWFEPPVIETTQYHCRDYTRKLLAEDGLCSEVGQ